MIKLLLNLKKYKKGEEYLELQKKMGIMDISILSERDNKKISSGDLGNYNSNSTGSNANTIESSSQINNSLNSISKINLVRKNEYNMKIIDKKNNLISNDSSKVNSSTTKT